MSSEDQEQFLRDSEQFGKDLAMKLENETGETFLLIRDLKGG